jgi:hypothetical protein
MSQECESPKTFLATEVLAAHRRVKLTSATGDHVEYADKADSSSYLGITVGPALAIEDPVGVELKGVTKTHKATAADSFAVGAVLYAADSGKVSDSSSGNAIGTALEAAGADGDIVEVILDGGAAAIQGTRATWAQEDAVVYPIPLTDLRTWDNLAVNIPATAANDDLALVTGTAGSAAPQVQGADFGATNDDKYTSFMFKLPPEYVAGETITLRCRAAMQVIADATATLDAMVYRQAAPTVDICATGAQSVNSATVANYDFTITPTDCVPGDLLRVILRFQGTDSGNAANYIQLLLSRIQMLLDIKG